jgi:hypothetical protein
MSIGDGLWLNTESRTVFHPQNSIVVQEYRRRTLAERQK